MCLASESTAERQGRITIVQNMLRYYDELGG